MKKIFLLFPNQLFKDISKLKEADEVFLVEEFLFFRQYKFHKQKLLFHRSGMKFYENYLEENNIRVSYIESINALSDIRNLIGSFSKENTEAILFYDVCDNWLERRIKNQCRKSAISFKELDTPLFINNKEDLKGYFEGKKKFFQTEFYILQRKKLKLLLDENEKPLGGKWSFDAENRLKYPKSKVAPKVKSPKKDEFFEEAVNYVENNFSDNPGNIPASAIYPNNHSESEKWLNAFLEERFSDFGSYEDAIVEEENFLHHSVLSPMLNVGLLLPMQIVSAALEYSDRHNIPMNNLEGFIRQIIGWREFIRGVYHYRGTIQRKTNFWKFHKKIPTSFYHGNTGIQPIDRTIKKTLNTAYNHHIERLMLIGNFMLLNEFNPDEVYQWFMEMYIDAYDWVMVPNVYGMSQFADGGLMSTKPYISGSSYLLKMSNFSKGDWARIWDALFWHFMNKHRTFFLTNPRLGMLIATYDKMTEAKKQEIKQIVAETKW